MVIAASALAEIASHMPGAGGEVLFRISEYLPADDLFAIAYVDDGDVVSRAGAFGDASLPHAEGELW